MSKTDLKQKILMIFFFSMPWVDLLTSFMTRFIDFPVTIGVVVKGLSLVVALVYVFFFSKCKYRKHTIFYVIGICIFEGIYFLTKPDIWNFSGLFTEVMYAFKYLYCPIMLLCLYNVFHDLDIQTSLIKKIVSVNCLVYAALLLIPYLTGTGFASYAYDFEGNTGWFYAANEIGAILIVLSICIFNFMDNDKMWKILLAAPIIYAISTIGTKVSYLGIIASVLISSVVFIFNNKKKRFLLPAMLISLLIACCFGSVAIDNINVLAEMDNLPPSLEDVTEEVTEYPIEDGFGDGTYDSAADYIRDHKLLNVINHALSNRILFTLENFDYLAKGGASSILFGLGWADRTSVHYNYYKKVIEIDIFDILVHFGLVGFAIYFAPFLYLIAKYLKHIKQIPVASYAYIFASLLILGISCIAGHILGAPAVSIYLILLILLVIRQVETKKV